MDIKNASLAYNVIAGLTPPTVAPATDTAPTTLGAASFSELLSSSLSDAVEAGKKAEKVSTLALMGKADITDMTIAVGSAERALSTVVAVRDKVINAYQQILQMPV